MGWLSTALFVLILSSQLQCSKTQSWIKAAHWDSASEIPVDDIDSSLFTHLFASFAHINTSTYQLSFKTSKLQYFSTFTDTVKRKNPSIGTILSIFAGKNEYSHFSLVASKPSYRRSFIESTIRTARLYGFQGLCLSGVEPKDSSNMENLGILLEEWRAAVVSEAKNSSKPRLLLTMLTYHVPEIGSISYPVESLQKNLDLILLMNFDYYVPTRDNFTQFHAALYDPSGKANTDLSVRKWIEKGFSPSKMVLGLPYHGYVWLLVDPRKDAFGSAASGPGFTLDGSMGYKAIKSYLRGYGNGINIHYSSVYVMSYCTLDPNWFNFDDVESIKAKVSYARKSGLGGYHVFQLANDENWVLSRAAGGQQKRNKSLISILLPSATAATFVLLGALLCYFKGIRIFLRNLLFKLKTKMSPAANQSSHSSNLHEFSYSQIKKATSNFSYKNKLGEGGFGPVYLGKLSNGKDIAVKRLSKTSQQGNEEFKNEVSLTAKLQHVNLVPVLGVCTEKEEQMLIYEYMPNKSLDFYLFDPVSCFILNWEKRIHIIEGIIQGLLYLQEYSNFTIIHRDLKSSNILLDSEMNPKISDFGMARHFKKDTTEANTGRIVGTYGYVPPEYVRNGIYSMKYDVFSFGVLLLQIISGKRNTRFYGPNENLNLLDYAYELWKDGEGRNFFDPSLDDSSSSYKLARCLQVALLCVQENPVDRPTILEVYTVLKTESAVIGSPKNPAFSVNKGNEENKHILREHIYSINDLTLSEVIPR